MSRRGRDARDRLFQLFDANAYDSRQPGFQIKTRFFTIGSGSTTYQDVRWAVEVIKRYKQGLKYGHIPYYPPQPKQRYSPMRGKKKYANELREVRVARELAAKERKRLSSKAYEKERQRDYSRPKKGRINPHKMGRKPAKDLLFNQQRRDPKFIKLRRDRQAAAKRGAYKRRKSLRS